MNDEHHVMNAQSFGDLFRKYIKSSRGWVQKDNQISRLFRMMKATDAVKGEKK